MSVGPEVILIDDECCTLELNKLSVKTVIPGAEVRGFLSARTALEYLRNKDAGSQGLIISDLHMPVVDGFEFLDEFNLLPPTVRDQFKVFVLSADADTADQERLSRKPNLAGFFSKPLTIKKFAVILRKAGYSV